MASGTVVAFGVLRAIDHDQDVAVQQCSKMARARRCQQVGPKECCISAGRGVLLDMVMLVAHINVATHAHRWVWMAGCACFDCFCLCEITQVGPILQSVVQAGACEAFSCRWTAAHNRDLHAHLQCHHREHVASSLHHHVGVLGHVANHNLTGAPCR